jgi:hypothetical protein
MWVTTSLSQVSHPRPTPPSAAPLQPPQLSATENRKNACDRKMGDRKMNRRTTAFCCSPNSPCLCASVRKILPHTTAQLELPTPRDSQHSSSKIFSGRQRARTVDRRHQCSLVPPWAAQESGLSDGRFVRISFPCKEQFSTVPSPPISGEKVAVRPDEGAVKDGRVQENPPHPGPAVPPKSFAGTLPSLAMCIHANNLGGTGGGMIRPAGRNKFRINSSTLNSTLLRRPVPPDDCSE